MDSERLYRYLMKNHSGKKDATLSSELEAVFLCKGTQIRKYINELRTRKIPACSSSFGYYYSENPNDIDDTITHLDSRIKKIELARSGLQKAKELILSRKEDNNGKED
ncbi:MAG: hypothetical protein BGN88_00940 [Clostridiales bacterium 43-6]|nr:MAG: hypothetical protein BGN88_00940 [Clostridiales bacterium 43-6]